jgi:hypothetical protein
MTLPARDAHQNLTIAADPYVSATRYTKELFGKKSPYDAGIIAIDVFFRNDNDAPIRISLDAVRLEISSPGMQHQELEALTAEDVADRTVLNAHANPHVNRLPFPLPGSNSGKGKAWDEMDTTLRAVALSTEVLPPHATTHGFLFFDMNHEFSAIRHCHLYIPDLSFMTDKKALFFFEIDLGVVPIH